MNSYHQFIFGIRIFAVILIFALRKMVLQGVHVGKLREVLDFGSGVVVARQRLSPRIAWTIVIRVAFEVRWFAICYIIGHGSDESVIVDYRWNEESNLVL